MHKRSSPSSHGVAVPIAFCGELLPFREQHAPQHQILPIRLPRPLQERREASSLSRRGEKPLLSSQAFSFQKKRRAYALSRRQGKSLLSSEERRSPFSVQKRREALALLRREGQSHFPLDDKRSLLSLQAREEARSLPRRLAFSRYQRFARLERL